MDMNNEYAAFMLHKAREHEIEAQAENRRMLASLRRVAVHQTRRALRINNNPVR